MVFSMVTAMMKQSKLLQRMAKETGINLNSIFNTLTKVMNIVRDECGEDVQDYFNKDYHLI